MSLLMVTWVSVGRDLSGNPPEGIFNSAMKGESYFNI